MAPRPPPRCLCFSSGMRCRWGCSQRGHKVLLQPLYRAGGGGGGLESMPGPEATQREVTCPETSSLIAGNHLGDAASSSLRSSSTPTGPTPQAQGDFTERVSFWAELRARPPWKVRGGQLAEAKDPGTWSRPDSPSLLTTLARWVHWSEDFSEKACSHQGPTWARHHTCHQAVSCVLCLEAAVLSGSRLACPLGSQWPSGE